MPRLMTHTVPNIMPNDLHVLTYSVYRQITCIQ
jgi:hypothetical protein